MGQAKKQSIKILATPRPLTLLSSFWHSYFEKVTLEFNKEIFAAFRSNHSVTFTHREIINARQYRPNLSHSVNLFFNVLPQGELGFISLPFEFASYVVEQSMGGRRVANGVDPRGQLSQLDYQIVLRFMLGLTRGLLSSMDSGEQMDIQLMDRSDYPLAQQQLDDHEFISVQQFSVSSEVRSFQFDLVFKQSVLK